MRSIRFVSYVLLSSLVLFLPSISAFAGDSMPIVVTLAQLISDPDRYSMKVVRVRGQVDTCSNFTCDLCPEDMTRQTLDIQKCLAMSFDGYEPDEQGGDDDLSAGRVAQQMEQSFRYATVTMDFLFDPTCLTAMDTLADPKANHDIVVVCTDRASVLEHGRVVAVHSRKSVLDGLVTAYDLAALIEVSPPEFEDMAASLRDFAPDVAKRQTKALMIEDESVFGPKYQRDGLFCVCRLEDCSGKWPTRYVLGFSSPANPFDCHEMVKRDGKWTALPH